VGKIVFLRFVRVMVVRQCGRRLLALNSPAKKNEKIEKCFQESLENVCRSSKGHGGRDVGAYRMEFRDGIDMKFQLPKKIAKKIAIEF
jgi:hypothetical protein